MNIDCQLTFRRCKTDKKCDYFTVLENSEYYHLEECNKTANHSIYIESNITFGSTNYFCDEHAIPAYIEHTDDNIVIQSLSMPDSLVKKLRTENDYNDRGIVIEADGSSNVHEVLGDDQ